MLAADIGFCTCIYGVVGWTLCCVWDELIEEYVCSACLFAQFAPSCFLEIMMHRGAFVLPVRLLTLTLGRSATSPHTRTRVQDTASQRPITSCLLILDAGILHGFGNTSQLPTNEVYHVCGMPPIYSISTPQNTGIKGKPRLPGRTRDGMMYGPLFFHINIGESMGCDDGVRLSGLRGGELRSWGGMGR